VDEDHDRPDEDGEEKKRGDAEREQRTPLADPVAFFRSGQAA
jgi:hypothetical protein